MRGAKHLTKRQLAVIEDLFEGRLDEQAILDKYKLSRKLYNNWLNDEHFTGQFEKRISDAYRQCSVLIARYAPVAAAKLIQLTESEKPETARKACLDIITMPVLIDNKKNRVSEDLQSVETGPPISITPEKAGRLLTVLAEKDND